MNLLSDIRTYLAVGWSRLRIFFKQPPSIEPIPEGHYCYQAMSDFKSFPDGGYGVDIKTCPYFHYVGKHKTACTFLGYVGDDLCHADSCKICGEKESYSQQEDLSKADENS